MRDFKISLFCIGRDSGGSGCVDVEVIAAAMKMVVQRLAHGRGLQPERSQRRKREENLEGQDEVRCTMQAR